MAGPPLCWLLLHLKTPFQLSGQREHPQSLPLDRLAEFGLMANTAVMMLADHGDMFGQQKLSQIFCPYDEVLRVPCAISWPGTIEPGTQCQMDVSHVDLAPPIYGRLPFATPDSQPRGSHPGCSARSASPPPAGPRGELSGNSGQLLPRPTHHPCKWFSSAHSASGRRRRRRPPVRSLPDAMVRTSEPRRMIYVQAPGSAHTRCQRKSSQRPV